MLLKPFQEVLFHCSPESISKQMKELVNLVAFALFVLRCWLRVPRKHSPASPDDLVRQIGRSLREAIDTDLPHTEQIIQPNCREDVEDNI
jgi:hypothetical protein